MASWLLFWRPWQTKTHCCGQLPMMFLGLRKLGNICCGHKMFLNKIKNIFLCPGHKICVRNKCCPRGQTGKHLCRQQCVGNSVSTAMCPRLPGPWGNRKCLHGKLTPHIPCKNGYLLIFLLFLFKRASLNLVRENKFFTIFVSKTRSVRLFEISTKEYR